MMGVGPYQALLPIFVGFPNLVAGGVVSLRIVEVLADEVGANGEVVIGIRFAVRHPDRVPGNARVAGFDIAQGQFEPSFIVVGRLFPIAAVLRHIGRTHAEVIGLELAVAALVFANVTGIDAGQNAARGIAGFHVGIDVAGKLMLDRLGFLHAVDRLAILGVRFAAHGVTHPGLGHQIALISGVDEHPSRKRPPALHDDPGDPCAAFDHSGFQIEALVENDRDLVLNRGEHGIIDRGGRMRFEGPHGLFAGGIAVLLAGEVFLPWLPRPLRRIGVVLEHLGIKLPREAADGLLVADVRGPEAASG